jgi:hypothetical protein
VSFRIRWPCHGWCPDVSWTWELLGLAAGQGVKTSHALLDFTAARRGQNASWEDDPRTDWYWTSPLENIDRWHVKWHLWGWEMSFFANHRDEHGCRTGFNVSVVTLSEQQRLVHPADPIPTMNYPINPRFVVSTQLRARIPPCVTSAQRHGMGRGSLAVCHSRSVNSQCQINKHRH